MEIILFAYMLKDFEVLRYELEATDGDTKMRSSELRTSHRKNLEKALSAQREKWGGIYELAEELGYQIAQESPASGTS
ncbi:hypothetical protein M9434_002512 [Picochlorum sp. BPE23]|nr:hypothetical protein M9434_002512 [Picochlorum sp. BPE23]